MNRPLLHNLGQVALSPRGAILPALLIVLTVSPAVAEARVVAYFSFNDMDENDDGTTEVTVNNTRGLPSLVLIEESGVLADTDGQVGTGYTDADGTAHASGQSVGWTSGILDTSVDPGDTWLLELDTTGYSDLQLRFDYRSTDAVFQDDTLFGPTQLTMEWSVGGGSFETIQVFDLTRDNSYNEFALDLSGIGELQNAVDVALRGTWSNDGSETIVGGAAPSIRMDNLEVTGVPEPASALLMLIAAAIWIVGPRCMHWERAAAT